MLTLEALRGLSYAQGKVAEQAAGADSGSALSVRLLNHVVNFTTRIENLEVFVLQQDPRRSAKTHSRAKGPNL
jgi:hypothetical protein